MSSGKIVDKTLDQEISLSLRVRFMLSIYVMYILSTRVAGNAKVNYKTKW